jgi:hypothetical protein
MTPAQQALSNTMETYASVKLNRIVERLVKEVLIDRPANVVPYLISFLEQHGEQVASGHACCVPLPDAYFFPALWLRLTISSRCHVLSS